MEIRKDYILDRYVFYAPGRKKRKREFKKAEKIKEKGPCFFCPGNENLTPKEIGRIEEKGEWKIRWFPNKFPVSELKGNANLRTSGNFFRFADSYGKHEVIAECKEHNKQLWDLDVKHIKQILDVYRNRIEELGNLKGVRYVIIFKNHGRESGTSLMHSHTQVSAVNIVPSLVQDEVNASKKGRACPYCKVIELERKKSRRCFENKTIAAFSPYASRFNYEIWIFPKKHLKNLSEFSEEEMSDLADILKKVLLKLRKLNVSYNFFLHYAPKGTNLHFHIEVTPRIATWGGFEISSDSIINSVLPEEAARFYRS